MIGETGETERARISDVRGGVDNLWPGADRSGRCVRFGSDVYYHLLLSTTAGQTGDAQALSG